MHTGHKAHILAIAATHRSQLAPDISRRSMKAASKFHRAKLHRNSGTANTPAEIVNQLQGSVEKGLAAGSPRGPSAWLRSVRKSQRRTEMTAAGFAAFIRADYDAMRDGRQARRHHSRLDRADRRRCYLRLLKAGESRVGSSGDARYAIPAIAGCDRAGGNG